MPSASSAKIEKQQSSNSNAEVVDNSSPIRQVLIIIEHKIRNLEKRKGKLESYRDIEKSGKELSADQKNAVSKYNEVAQTLEFARDFSKQIVQIATISEKDLKKKQKKDEMLKKQNETARIREVLIIQDILRLMTEEGVREHFLNGTNGACKLEESDLELLTKFSEDIAPKRPTSPDEIPFTHAAQKSADHLSLAIDSKSKSFGQGTYADVKNIFRNIQKSGYFDKASLPPPLPPAAQPEEEEEVNQEETPATSEEMPADVQKSLEQEAANVAVTGGLSVKIADAQDFQEAPAATAVPVPTFPPQQIVPVQPTQIVQPIPIVQPIVPVVGITNVAAPTVAIPPSNQMHPTHMQPTTVRAVEQAYFKQHQYMQQMRPLAEVIGTGNFFFLQDSELDSPDIMPPFPQPPSNTQISPTPQTQQQQQPLQAQHQQQQAPPQQQPPVHQQQTSHPQQQPTQNQQQQPPQVLQQPPSQPPAPQIAGQPYSGQTFSNIVPTQMFQGIKPTDVSQPHIPGFATPNAPIPIPLVQSAAAPLVQQQQQQQIPQPTLINQPTNPNHAAGQTGTLTIGTFSAAGKIVTPILSNESQMKPPSPPKESRSNDHHQKREIEQRVPEITEWKAEDANKPPPPQPHEEITEWRDLYENAEVNDWNEDAQEESNTWSNSHRYNYRGHQQNNYNNGRNNRGPPGRAGANPTNGYRGRSNNTYNPNGRQSGSNSGGGGGGNGNTFYRNNDSYYHNQQNGSGGGYRGGNSNDANKDSTGYRGGDSHNKPDGGNSGGGGGYRGDKQETNYRTDRDNKNDGGGYRGGNNFRSREPRDNGNNGPMRQGGRPTNRHNSNSGDRGGQGSQSTSQQRGGPMQNNAANSNNRNGPPTIGSGGGPGGNPRPNNNKGQNMYGTNSRVTTGGPSSRPPPPPTQQASVNV